MFCISKYIQLTRRLLRLLLLYLMGTTWLFHAQRRPEMTWPNLRASVQQIKNGVSKPRVVYRDTRDKITTWRIECITYSCSTKSSWSNQLFFVKPTIFGYLSMINYFWSFLLEAKNPLGSGFAQALLQSCWCVPHVFRAGASLCCLWNFGIHKELCYAYACKNE